MNIPRGSVEYIRAEVEADVDLETTGVALAIVYDDETPTWLPGQWIDDTGSTRIARTNAVVTLDTVGYPHSTYTVLVKLTDSPESPILEAYTLNLT